ncbi:MAG: nucleotidyltransferase substrate binding protein [Bacteroidia bacterium]|nr:nucleotidyltransferase substrate binding protein [Bacteroidia bacterium]
MDARKRVEIAEKALGTLEAIPLPPASDIQRDAAIQRFEYTFEAVWKASAAVLYQIYGVKLSSPKPVIRACRENALFTAEMAALFLQMTDHRNLTAHTYNPAVAELIAKQLPTYRMALRSWVEALKKALEEDDS